MLYNSAPLFDSSSYLNQEEFTISGWFYTCQAGDYHIISRQDIVATYQEYFSIRVDGNGQYIVNYYQNSTQTFYTGIYSLLGWNYFALSIDYITVTTYGVVTYFNTLTLYAGHDQFATVDVTGNSFYAKIQKFSSTWQRQATINTDIPASSTGTTILLGCRQFPTAAGVTDMYTGFMHGFIYSIRIYNQAVGIEILAQDWSKQFTAKMDFSAGISNSQISDSSGLQNNLQLSPDPPISQDQMNFYINSIPQQGLLFAYNKYVKRPAGDTYSFTISSTSQMFCIESWFKLDNINQNPDNFIGYLFGKYDTVNQDKKWHFIQACFRKSEVTSDTQMLLWIDDKDGADIQTFDGSYTDSTAYDVYAGKDFAGIMRTLSLSCNVDWDCSAEDSIISAHITSNKNYISSIAQNITNVSSACLGYGATKTCNYCSSLQYPTQTQLDQCFSECGLNTYDEACIVCDYRCKYCTDNTLLTCAKCNEFNFAFKNSTGLCQCAPGYYTNNSAQECTKCNENCALCENSTNICLICAKGSYRIYNNQCVKVCPSGYVGSDEYGICVYAPIEVESPDFIKGCSSHQYFDEVFGACKECHSECQTCFGEFNTDCLTCDRGRYLYTQSTYDTYCKVCDPVGMNFGTSGDCIEICGDGKDFGLNPCEDGNLDNGDGCSSTCQIEYGYTCTGGTPSKMDVCLPILTQIEKVTVTNDNNLLLEFSKDVMILGELGYNDFEVVVYKTIQGRSLEDNLTKVKWSLAEETYEMLPSRVLYLKLDQKQLSGDDSIIEGIKDTQRIGVRYLGTGKLRDINNHDVNAYQLSSAYLNYEFVKDQHKIASTNIQSQNLGLASSSFLLAGVLLNLMTYLITQFLFLYIFRSKSLIPAYYAFTTSQTIYLMLMIKSSNYPSNLFNFLSYFDYTLFEFKFIPVFLKDELIDTYIPVRGVFSDELENYGYYYNTIVYNIFRKIFFWVVYFAILLPIALLARKLFGEDLEAMNVWPDKFFFSGTMIIFYAMIQPFTMASIAEIQMGRKNSDYEYASFSLACLFIAVVPFRFISNTILCMVCEVLLIILNGISLNFSSSDAKRTTSESTGKYYSSYQLDMSFMIITLLFSLAFFIYTIIDSFLSIRIWKKAKDNNQPNPFYIIPSYKFKNKKLIYSAQGLFEKQADGLDLTKGKGEETIMMTHDQSHTQLDLKKGDHEDSSSKLKDYSPSPEYKSNKDKKDADDFLDNYYGNQNNGGSIIKQDENDHTMNQDTSFSKINLKKKPKGSKTAKQKTQSGKDNDFESVNIVHSQAKRKLLEAQQKLLTNTKRSFQTFGKNYLTGFDRMLLDKLNWAGFNGHWFALFGIGNLLAYGASFVMRKDQYEHHFRYRGNPISSFKPLKAMLGSEDIANVIWTAPSLIGLSAYLLPKVGSLVMTKFFFLSLFSTWIFWSALQPEVNLNYRPLKKYIMNFDSMSEGKYYQGADQIAQSIIYFTLLYHRMWRVALPFMAFDLLYYGPATIGGPGAAIVGAFMFL